MGKVLYILFAVVSFAAILEFLLVCGSFTGPLAMLLVFCVGTANVVFSLKIHDKRTALLFLLATVGLCMGYWKLMF